MKTKVMTLNRRAVALGLFLFVVTAAVLAMAGDDYKARVLTNVTSSTCSSQLRPNSKYAVQCSQACYILVTANPDAGVTSATGVAVAQNALYDTPTTTRQMWICGMSQALDAGFNIYLNRNINE